MISRIFWDILVEILCPSFHFPTIIIKIYNRKRVGVKHNTYAMEGPIPNLMPNKFSAK